MLDPERGADEGGGRERAGELGGVEVCVGGVAIIESRSSSPLKQQCAEIGGGGGGGGGEEEEEEEEEEEGYPLLAQSGVFIPVAVRMIEVVFSAQCSRSPEGRRGELPLGDSSRPNFQSVGRSIGFLQMEAMTMETLAFVVPTRN
ncbi:unnamed protein product [Pleuronectes platessa]|uniref:Uncharacterized protein n=1 Tax=Pleuronectes platessa TaxID=8262 RepID=A0A9N7VY32_PLEPL|nr:unnamed protein product [Pleuronectes platessa]